MLDLTTIGERYIVAIDKHKIGVFAADVVDTQGKYLIFRENHVVDNTLYDTCGCAILDAEFVEKHLNMFTPEYHKNCFKDLQYALDNNLLMVEVEEHRASSKQFKTLSEWREAKSSAYKFWWGDIHKRIEAEHKQLNQHIALGEYRLGVFIK
jgi:hypothetical protein